MTNSTTITLKLTGKRQLEAFDWMLGKPAPEEIDPEGRELSELGFSLIDGIASIPAHLLTDFIEECEDGALVHEEMTDDPYEGADARAMVRALGSIIEKLEAAAYSCTQCAPATRVAESQRHAHNAYAHGE